VDQAASSSRRPALHVHLSEGNDGIDAIVEQQPEAPSGQQFSHLFLPVGRRPEPEIRPASGASQSQVELEQRRRGPHNTFAAQELTPIDKRFPLRRLDAACYTKEMRRQQGHEPD